MKKILLFLMLLLPLTVKAYGIDEYNIEATILEDGSMRVIETFEMNGDFNGMNRIINYKSNYNSGYELSSTGNNKIYDASDIELISIMGVSHVGEMEGEKFTLVDRASRGDYGKYTISKTSNGYSYMIYNPSSHNKVFYIEYIIKDLAITHNDVTEVGWNIFTEMNESIKHLNINIHIPSNKDLLRVWAHGPLYGESKIVDNNTLNIQIDGLDSYEAIDVRFVFDKILNTSKKTNEDVLDNIIKIETKLADEANQIREKLKQQDRINYIITTAYIGILLFLIVNTYLKYDKEYKSEFNNEYFRDFPSDYSPSTVGYLVRKKVNNDDLSACILDLIRLGAIEFEELGKKDYLFKRGKQIEFSSEQENVMNFIFEYSSVNEIKLSEIKKKARKNYDSFMAIYDKWKTNAEFIAQKENFYEEQVGSRAVNIIICIVGIIVMASQPRVYFANVIAIILSVVSLIYFFSYTKRSRKGNEEYKKWMALKKFMEDFGTMDTKELPEVRLWDKYLVYAITLGCADNLAKVMKIKIAELQEQGVYTPDLFDYYRFNRFLMFNTTLNRTINSSVQAANSAKVAASSKSSGGGFGGGFSGGGGSFGGGGGGGRF